MRTYPTVLSLLLILTNVAAAADLATVRGKTVMVVQAHPDDAESRCAGTVALLKKNGNKIVYVVCSNDDKGTYDPKATLKSQAALRKSEEEKAVKVLAVDALEWLGYEDGWVDMVPKDKLRGDIRLGAQVSRRLDRLLRKINTRDLCSAPRPGECI